MTNGIYYNSTAGTLNFLVNNQPSIQINSGGTTVISGTTIFNGTISATTIVSPSLDVTITGGTYSQSSGALTLTNSTGGTVPVSGTYQYVTGGTYTAGTITLRTNTGGTTTITDLVGRAGVLGGVNFLTRWSTQYDLQDSRVFDDGSFMGFSSTVPSYSEAFRFDSSYNGITIDDVYFINTGNGSIGIATGGDYSAWAGNGEIAIGTRGPLLNSTGNGNIGIGDLALVSNTTGGQNIAIGGTLALSGNIDGSDNIGIGASVLTTNTSGINNIGIGTNSLFNTIDSNNISIGVNAGLSNTTGGRNLYIGTNSGQNNNGSNNIFIGYGAGISDTVSENKLNIGETIFGDMSSKLIGINVSNPTNTLDIGGNVGVTGDISASTYSNLPGSSSSNCYGTFYTSSISGCSPVTILTPLNASNGLNVTGVTVIQTLSASTFLNSAQYNAGILQNSDGWINNNNGTITLPSVNVSLFNQTGYPNTIQINLVSSGTSGLELPSLSNNDTNYIVIDYNGGSPTWDILTDNSTVNGTTIILTHIVYRANNFLHVLDFGDEGIALPNKLNDRVIAVDRFARESGFSLGLSGSGIVTLSSGIAWNGTNRQSLVSVDSQNDVFFQNFHSGSSWVYTTTSTTLNNTYYDTSTNRVAATAGKYLVNWYFRGQEINDHLYEVWGNDEYDSVAEAQLSVEPSLPELITSHAFLTGRIIVLVGATSGLVESAFVQVFQSTQVTQHNDLTSIQGGSAGQYYHLTSSQYSNNVYSNVDNTFSTSQTFNSGIISSSVSATTYQNLPISGLTQGSNITITNNGSGNYTINSTGGGGSFTGGTVTGPTNFTNGLSANTFSASTYQGNVVTQINAGSGISVDQSVGSVTITSTGGGTSLGLVYTTGNNLNFI